MKLIGQRSVLDPQFGVRTVQFEGALEAPQRRHGVLPQRPLRLAVSLVFVLQTNVRNDVNILKICSYKTSSSNFNIVSMVTNTLMGKRGYTPILSTKGSAHKNGDVDGTCK